MPARSPHGTTDTDDGATQVLALAREPGGMTLQTMQPADDWVADDETTIETLGSEAYEFHVFGGDWCGDCQRQLPAFAAALAAAGVEGERIHHYPVAKREDGSKTGPGVEPYGIEYIPTVVVERDGEERARFVESADESIASYLAAALDDADQ